MSVLFDKYNVQVVALSKDTVAQAKKHQKRDDLPFPLLADPELKVIQSYGLVHQNGFEFYTFFLFGIPIGWPTKFNQMGIPYNLYFLMSKVL